MAVEVERSIFRAEALRRYREGRDKPVLPCFVMPRVVLCSWILLGLGALAVMIASLVEVPVYASGPAVVVATGGERSSEPDGLIVLAMLPPEHLTSLRVGEDLILQPARGGASADEYLASSVVAVEPDALSPEALRRRWNVRPVAETQGSERLAVAVARFEPSTPELPVSAYVGSVYHAEIAVGSRRLLSLVPLIGARFGA